MWFGNLEGRKMKNRITYEATVAKNKTIRNMFFAGVVFFICQKSDSSCTTDQI